MRQLNKTRKNLEQHIWELRLGIHTGEVVAGVVGKKKFVYDIWGDSVNIASRMETAGEVGKVNISETTYNEIKEFFDCEHRGKIEAKNKGKIDMYFVKSISKEYSIDGKGIEPNEDFLKMLSEM
jgi:class 3 adenylate cyclase